MWKNVSLVPGPVAHLQLTRPDSLNSLSAQTLRDLADAAATLDDEVRVLIVSGDGSAFSAGADFELLESRDAGEPLDPREAAALGGRMADAIEQIPAVTIAAMWGPVVGGGLVLAAACDLRLAHPDTYFSIPEVDLGLPLAWGGVPRLVRELGPALTRELILTCRPFTADEAMARGFLNDVVDDPLRRAESLAETIAAKSRYATQSVKQAVGEALESMAPAHDRSQDVDALAGAMVDPESVAAKTAYLEERRSR